eukprot:6468948-Amphidinium_carterae.1
MRDVVPASPADNALNKAVLASQSLMSSTGFDWSRQSLRTEIESAHAFLQRIQSQETMLPSSNVTNWLRTVAVRLEVFCYVEVPVEKKKGKKKDDEAEPDTAPETQFLYGAKALEKLYGDIVKKKGPEALSELHIFAIWKHLLSETQAVQVAQWRDSLLKDAPKPSMPSKGAPSEKQAKKKQRTEADLQAAALAFLKKGA